MAALTVDAKKSNDVEDKYVWVHGHPFMSIACSRHSIVEDHYKGP